MQKDQVYEFIKQKVVTGQEVTPFLFVSQDLDTAKKELETIIYGLMDEFGVDKNYMFTLPQSEESLKIEEVRNFVSQSFTKASFAFQVFVIEDISRLTGASANSMLKFLEEPGLGNIICMTNQGEAGVLDTILSRVQVCYVGETQTREFQQEYFQMISQYVEHNNPLLLTHFFSQVPSKAVALDFLYTLLQYIKQTGTNTHILSSIDDDITGLEKSNFLPKYVIDKYIMLLHRS